MLKDFYDISSKPIVTLEDFYGPKKSLLDKCIILFSNHILEYVLKNYKCEKIAELTSCQGSNYVYAFDYNNERIGVYLSPLGSALAGGELLEANHLTGATKFIMFGSCGSLDNDATNGKYLIPTEAYRGEGLSYYFAKAEDYIKIKNADIVADIFKSLNIPFVKGKVWTTDSMLRETVNLVNKRKQEGCIGVEMELAGVQAVCSFYGFELFDFLACGDVVVEDNYQIANLKNANSNADKFLIALEIIKKI